MIIVYHAPIVLLVRNHQHPTLVHRAWLDSIAVTLPTMSVNSAPMVITKKTKARVSASYVRQVLIVPLRRAAPNIVLMGATVLAAVLLQ